MVISPLKASMAIFNFNDALIFFFISSSFLIESNSIKISRKNGPLFGGHYSENRHAITQEQEMVKMQEKAMLEMQKQRIEQEVTRQKERDFSISM